MNRGGGGGGRKVLLPPINFIFKLLQQHSTVQIWLYEQLAIRIEGRIRVSDYQHWKLWCCADGCF
jgi:small nuclear ribonucleoprotein E